MIASRFLCLTGAISNSYTLFTYDSKDLLDTYYNAEKHDKNFLPVFYVFDNPNDTLANNASSICTGEGSDFCRCCRKIFSTFIFFFSLFL